MKKNTIIKFTTFIVLILSCLILLTQPLLIQAGRPWQNITTPSRSHEPSLTQMLPHLMITNVTITPDTPEDGDVIQLSLNVKNNDNNSYTGINLLVNLTEFNLSVQRLGGNDNTEKTSTVANHTITFINASQSLTVTISFKVEYGQYQITCYLASQGVILPSSIYSLPLDVLNQPIGDDKTLIIALTSSLIVIYLMMYVPSINDVIKVKHTRK